MFVADSAYAQEDASRSLQYGASGSLRVRGFSLSNGTAASDLDPVTRGNLQLTGQDDIDATQNFLDSRMRLSLHVTAYQEVTAKMQIEVGDITFGDGAAGGGLGTDGRVFENKNLYLEWHPTRYSFSAKAGLYSRESDPYGIILSDDVAGIHGEVELLGTETSLYLDYIKAVEGSRLDLDNDGIVDNDYNDRDIILFGVNSAAIPMVDLEAFFMADVNNTQDTPVANTEQDTYWVGLSAKGRVGPAHISSTAIWARGKRTVTGTPGTTIRGLAFDTRVSMELPFVTLDAIFAWASGTDPDRQNTDTGFPTIAPFYGVSGIVYGNYGGFNATG
ncbi:hypothetical protein OAX78_02930, partial [Planctomycetota bacterium]|nr:hypothetical protein [Planctomycetota bacterium]